MIEELTAADRKKYDDITIDRGVWPCYETYRQTGIVAKQEPYPIWSIYILLKSKGAITATERDLRTVAASDATKHKDDPIPYGFVSRSSYYSEQFMKSKTKEVFDRMKKHGSTIEQLKAAKTKELGMPEL